MPSVEAIALELSYGSRLAVAELSFEVVPGRVLGLLGPNGAGKSTTMNALSGLHAPVTGQVLLDGEDLYPPQPAKAARIRRKIGYLPERPPLDPELTVEEYLEYCGQLRGMDRMARQGALNRLCGELRLEDERRRVIGRLSKGTRQRVGLAQAVLHGPELVVLDEPIVGLDPNQTDQVRGFLQGLREGRCIVISSHLLHEVGSLCDEILVLRDGRPVLHQNVSALAAGQTELLHMRWYEPVTPDALQELASLPGIDRIEDVTSGVVALRCRDRRRAFRSLVRACSANGWPVEEIFRPNPSLETVFRRLTTGEREERGRQGP